MQIALALLIGIVLGIFAGGFLSYKYADKVVAKAIAEYDRLKQTAENLKRAL